MTVFNDSDFFGRQTTAAVLALAPEDGGIEIASQHFKDHSIDNSIHAVALFHQRIHYQLTVGIGNGLLGLRLAVGVFGGDLVVGHGRPCHGCDVRVSGATGRSA
jgi:hypothetical protein